MEDEGYIGELEVTLSTFCTIPSVRSEGLKTLT
jgi:hypothetical protein